MKVKTKMNRRALSEISGGAVEALQQTIAGSRNSILGEIMAAEVTPKQTGELERSAHIDEAQSKRGKVSIVYDTPYARRLYYHPEYNFRRDKNRDAQGLWLEAWATGKKDNIIKKVFSKLWQKLAGGFIR
ncbi:hypothetical protein SAMN04487969_101127 [Paenibacillus algorifonticola]|uniref:Minor capsid protein n=1 Tax=Paenibacillus algorifonticola TaxID=684063 RepID=A0A1I1XWA3_9BACL|nr:hypothetical protein [Paenibacillus algorifonticola]SFE11449.1 hypothetical protein SAMN04487969_101127 [Paenibacillus algorifonticola]